jgi:PPP family 3-phenylpropionic acid transporter
MAVRTNGPIAYIALYAAMYAAFGVASPFWPKFFETKALTSPQIGLILGAGMLVRLAAAPLVGRLADASGSLRSMLAACAGLAATMAAALLVTDSFWPLIVIASLQAAALAPMTSIADALSVNSARPQLAGRPFEYGWIRGAGSAAFILGTLTIGQLISGTDLDPIVWMNIALLAAAAVATGLLPGADAAREPRKRSLPADDPRGQLRLARFRNLLVVSALVYGSHAMHDAFAVIRWSDAGMAPSAISMLWSEAVAAEVIVFFLIGPWLLRRIGTRNAAAIAAVAGVIRWSVAGATTSILPLAMVQPLHGLTFALLHLACMRMMQTIVPVSLCATAQGLYAFSAGVATATLTLLSGVLFARYGGLSFYPMAALCGVAIPLAWLGLPDERK